MDKLQKLDRELDIAQSTGTEFDLSIRLLGWDVLLHALAHRLR